MNRFLLISLVCLGVLLSSSCAPRLLPHQTTDVRERTVVREEVRIVKAPVPLPSELRERTTSCDTIHAETSLATADAWRDSLGALGLRIQNKDTAALALPERVREVEVVRDSVVIIERPVIEKVERPLSWFQRAQIWAGRIFMIIVLVAIAALIAKIMKKRL